MRGAGQTERANKVLVLCGDQKSTKESNPSQSHDGKLYFELRLLQIVARYHPIINDHSVLSSYRKSDRNLAVPTSGPLRPRYRENPEALLQSAKTTCALLLFGNRIA